MLNPQVGKIYKERGLGTTLYYAGEENGTSYLLVACKLDGSPITEDDGEFLLDGPTENLTDLLAEFEELYNPKLVEECKARYEDVKAQRTEV